MNVKYKKYIEYIVSDIQVPYLKSLEAYGLKKEDMDLVLSKLFNESVIYIKQTGGVYNKNRSNIYREMSDGSWERRIYNKNNNQTYYEDSYGNCCRREYDSEGCLTLVKDNG